MDDTGKTFYSGCKARLALLALPCDTEFSGKVVGAEPCGGWAFMEGVIGDEHQVCLWKELSPAPGPSLQCRRQKRKSTTDNNNRFLLHHSGTWFCWQSSCFVPKRDWIFMPNSAQVEKLGLHVAASIVFLFIDFRWEGEYCCYCPPEHSQTLKFCSGLQWKHGSSSHGGPTSRFTWMD